MRIPWRIILYVLLPLGMLLSVVGWRVLVRLERDLELSLTREVEVIGRALQTPVSRAIEERNHNQIQETLNAVFRIGSVYSAFVYDADGRLLASAGRGGDNPVSYRDFHAILETGEPAGTYTRIDGRRVYSAFIPVKGVFSESLGMVQINRDSREIRSSIGNIRIRGVFLAIAIVLLTAFVVLAGHYVAHGRAVLLLSERIERIERGEREIDANVSGPREIARLGHALNRLVSSLDSAESEIRERKAVEGILREQADRSERLVELGKLAGGLAHELGAPLSVIRGMVRRLRQNLNGNPSGLDHTPTMDRIDAEVQRTELLVRDMLEFGKGRRNRVNCDLAEVVAQGIHLAESDLEAHRCTVKVEVLGEVVPVSADPLRLGLAVRNLLSNAARHSPSSEIIATLSFARETVSLSIRDWGEGVREGMHDLIFQPFVSSEGSGHGLGLAIVQQIVREHQGIVRAVSLSNGTEFRVRLPLEGMGS